ncbi:caspase-like isoform X2 [Pararge aegeria]|uniref:caspase-like isoform X2 n=1 Tax=Pararge aegeria TaxID=116150 RepID=UPI0019D0464B|nr:caspase-like isoform X2 [Pararge aegeria]
MLVITTELRLHQGRNATADSSVISNVKEISYYDVSGEKYLTIFNHYCYKNTRYFQYKKPSSRIGTNEDVKRLTNTFQNMDYKVTCHDDMDYGDIIDKIIEISKQDHKETSCLCFAFLTHGLKGGDLFAADRPYQFKDVTILLENGHPSLVGKPKLFFIQACRGDQIDSGRKVVIDGPEVSVNIPTHADFLVLYSSVENFVSYRDRDGSFLVQELCDIIEEYHQEWDILHIITLVQRRIAYYRATFSPANLSIHEKKQMPETRFSLTKLFKFRS